MRQAGLIGLAIALCAATTPLDRAAAQVTAEQQSAIRAACRSDLTAKCADVAPGGKDALSCLQKNVAGLQPACKTAISATIPAPAPAVAAKPAPPAPAVTAAPPPPQATSTAAAPPAHRPGQSIVVSAPPPRASLPTRANAPRPPQAAPQPSPPPQQAVVAPPLPAAVAPPPAATKRPNAPVVMTAAIGRACSRDLEQHCRGSGAGDSQKIACLTARGQKLAPACKTALKI